MRGARSSSERLPLSAGAYWGGLTAQAPFTTLSPVRHQGSAHGREGNGHARRDLNHRRGEALSRRSLAVLGALVLVLVLAAPAGAKRQSSSITGAGSSFVSKLVQAWIPKVDNDLGIKVTYGPIGSGGGINAISSRTVDFGASDAPLTPDQFAACKGCVQIPWALSATSIAYRGDGLPNHIHLTGKVLSDIFLGKIKNWSDPAIKKLNAGKSLPSLAITVIHRSDNSGTTYNLTEYLSKASKVWKAGPGKVVADADRPRDGHSHPPPLRHCALTTAHVHRHS